LWEILTFKFHHKKRNSTTCHIKYSQHSKIHKLHYPSLALDKRLAQADHIKSKRVLLNSRWKYCYLLDKHSKLSIKTKLPTPLQDSIDAYLDIRNPTMAGGQKIKLIQNSNFPIHILSYNWKYSIIYLKSYQLYLFENKHRRENRKSTIQRFPLSNKKLPKFPDISAVTILGKYF